jgi:hypothetical protein
MVRETDSLALADVRVELHAGARIRRVLARLETGGKLHVAAKRISESSSVSAFPADDPE